ncbi:MAG TPA: hypothetical protein VMU30_04980 [Bacteroidota bacterium]|nr:hypothetical protein [Bacteroidota bacterium]
MRRLQIVAVFSVTLAGCIPSQSDSSISLGSEVYTNYEIGKTQKAAIGDPLIRVTKGKFLITDVYEATSTDTISQKGFYSSSSFVIKKGDKFSVEEYVRPNFKLRPLSTSYPSSYILMSTERQVLKINDYYSNYPYEPTQKITFEKVLH